MEKVYYMNNVCEIIRVINDDFSEIKVYPKFNDDIEGSYWCTECMVGNQGTPIRHTCEEYQEIIDSLEDCNNAIFCIVENRLIHDKPIEFKAIKILAKDIEDKQKQILQKSSTLIDLTKIIEEKEKRTIELNSNIDKAKDLIDRNNKELERLNDEITNSQKRYILSTPENINLTKEEYELLVKRDFILQKLEEGGVDNWEWYEESYPSDEDLSNIENRL